MKKLFDTAQSLLDSVEKVSMTLEGLNVLAEAFEICSDIITNSDYYQLKERAKNLISTHRRRVFLKVEKIIANPTDYKYEELDYWNKVMRLFIDFEFGNSEFILKQEALSKQMKNARWESFSKSEQDKEIFSIIEKLNNDEKETLLEEIKGLKKFHKKVQIHLHRSQSLRPSLNGSHVKKELQNILQKADELTCELKRYIWDRYG